MLEMLRQQKGNKINVKFKKANSDKNRRNCNSLANINLFLKSVALQHGIT